MHKNSYDPIALEYLAAVVEEGSFERAAKRLCITQSAVSQRLSTLENQAGQPLVLRSRPVAPTSAGILLLQHVSQLRALRVDLKKNLWQLSSKKSKISSFDDHISIAVDPDSLATWLKPSPDKIIGEDYLFEILVDNFFQTSNRLRDGRVQACVSAVEVAPKQCISMPLGTWQYVAVAQVDFVKQLCPTGLCIGNFRELPFIATNRKGEIPSRFISSAFGLQDVRLRQVFVPSVEARLAATYAGWGICIVPQASVLEQLAAGELVNIAPNHSMPITMYWQRLVVESKVLSELSDDFSKKARAYFKEFFNPQTGWV